MAIFYSVTEADDVVSTQHDTVCTTDYLVIPGGENSLNFEIGQTRLTDTLLCGRFVAATKREDNARSVCSKFTIFLFKSHMTSYSWIYISFLAQQTPFTVGFVSDADEITATDEAIMAANNELSGIPGGIHGFWIDYAQIPC